MNSLRRIGFLILLTLSVVALIGLSDMSSFGNSEAKSSLAEEAWGQAGSIAYQAAARTMRTKNGEGKPLDNVQKRYLRRYFIDYLDRVTPYQSEDLKQLAIRAHEMVHVRQCAQNGGLDQFGYQYFVEYKRAEQKYENNLMEREAYDLQSRFVKTNQ